MTPMIQNTQIVYAKPPADGALPDPAGTDGQSFNRAQQEV